MKFQHFNGNWGWIEGYPSCDNDSCEYFLSAQTVPPQFSIEAMAIFDGRPNFIFCKRYRSNNVYDFLDRERIKWEKEIAQENE